MQVQSPAAEINVGDYWEAIKNKWHVWTSTALIATLTAGVWSYCVRSTQYQADTSIIVAGQITPSTTGVTGILANVPIALPTGVSSEAELCRYILQTRATREAVAAECNLQQLYKTSSAAEATRRLDGWTRIELERPNIVRLQITLPGPPRIARFWIDQDAETMATQAARVAESYLSALSQCLSKLQLTAAKRRRVFLHQQKQHIERELRTAEDELQKWQKQHKVIQVDDSSKLAMQRLMALEEQREEARVRLAEARQRAKDLRDRLGKQPQVETASVVWRENPIVEETRKNLVSLESELAVAKEVEGKSVHHPEVRKLQQEIETAQQTLAREQRAMVKTSLTEVANPLVRKLREELALEEAGIVATEARVEGIGQALRRAELQITDLSAEVLEYSRLARRVRIKQTVFETVSAEYEQALIEEQGAEPVFQVLDKPVAPLYPSGPNTASDMGLAGAIGVLVGWVWIMAVGLERRS